jgi:oxygen-independent coproporphyrinogen-3 oxidase
MTQLPASGSQLPASALYLHIPFCSTRCAYCDFNTYAGLEALFEPYAEALTVEIRQAGESAGRPPAHTLFVGGGTPTFLPVPLLARALDACTTAFALEPAAEITCEANPGTTDRARFAALRGLGINRLSLGVQSFDDGELRWLGRIHTALDAEVAYDQARAAGFDNINLDLIFGLPENRSGPPGPWRGAEMRGRRPDVREEQESVRWQAQFPESSLEAVRRQRASDRPKPPVQTERDALRSWRRTLERAVALGPEHLALYGLTVEPGTPLGRRVRRGVTPRPDEDLAADLYDLACDVLHAAGYVHYEISNWAKRPAMEPAPARHDGAPPSAAVRLCRHNMVYWRREPYLGFGAGAHSFDGARRWWNVRTVPRYISRVGDGLAPRAGGERIGRRLAMAETMMLGLRLLEEGVPEAGFRARFGVGLDDAFGAEIGRLVDLGSLERLPDRIRLAPSAWLIANRVFAEFMPDDHGP